MLAIEEATSAFSSVGGKTPEHPPRQTIKKAIKKIKIAHAFEDQVGSI